MYQEGIVTIAKCKKCNESFPVFTFVADTDMITNGCISLSAKGNKIALTIQQPNENVSDVETRVGSGYKVVPVRYQNNSPSANAMSFQNFNKAYIPQTPIYSCINCGFDSEGIKTETKEQFLSHGTIEVLNGS